MKYKVLITAPYFQPFVENYRDFFNSHNIETIVPPIKEKMSEEELLGLKYLPEIDGVICGDDRFTEKVLSQAKNLKVISKWGTGIDAIDLKAASRLGIPVKNTPNAFTEPVADTAMGFILCFARKTLLLNEKMKQGLWQKALGVSLKECIIGIVGVGNIGKALTKRAKGFGMRVLGNDIKEIPSDFIKETGLENVSLEKLLKEADFVSLNCDLNPTSYHLLNEERFVLMKPTVYVINTARGPIIDEKALIKALSSKKIAGAGLDVFEQEPLPLDNPLLKFPNVILSPHNANSSPIAWEKVHENTIKNLIGELLKNQ